MVTPEDNDGIYSNERKDANLHLHPQREEGLEEVKQLQRQQEHCINVIDLTHVNTDDEDESNILQYPSLRRSRRIVNNKKKSLRHAAVKEGEKESEPALSLYTTIKSTKRQKLERNRKGKKRKQQVKRRNEKNGEGSETTMISTFEKCTTVDQAFTSSCSSFASSRESDSCFSLQSLKCDEYTDVKNTMDLPIKETDILQHISPIRESNPKSKKQIFSNEGDNFLVSTNSSNRFRICFSDFNGQYLLNQDHEEQIMSDQSENVHSDNSNSRSSYCFSEQDHYSKKQTFSNEDDNFSVNRNSSNKSTSGDETLFSTSDSESINKKEIPIEKASQRKQPHGMQKNEPETDWFITESNDDLIEHRKVNARFYLREAFKKKLLLSRDEYLVGPTIFHEKDGKKYELVCSELINNTNVRFKGGHDKYFKSYYLAASNGGMSTASELSRIADFESLTLEEGIGKTIARLKLLVSPACKTPSKRTCIYQMPLNEFQVIKDNGHEGCGYIPKASIAKLFGSCKKAVNIFAIQVRIFSPSGFGIAKGMLCVKNYIEKIQIPKSMIKVNQSVHDSPLHLNVILVVVKTCPSLTCQTMGNMYNATPNATLKQRKKLKLISPMFQNVLQAKGVNETTLNEYIDDFKSETNRFNHASLVGIIDPTNTIPKNHVFLTGMNDKEPSQVFLTRHPCTESKDGIIVNVSKKNILPKKAQKFLSSLKFGAVVFPLGIPSLPSKINNGDLDGDLYFALWDKQILAEMKSANDDYSIDYHEDNLISLEFKLPMIDGTSCNVEVIGSNGDDVYEVGEKNKKTTLKTLTCNEIFEGRDSIHKVIEHKEMDNCTYFNVHWVQCNTQEWKTSQELKKMHTSPPDVLLDYVFNNKLGNDCKWITKHFGSSKVTKIIDHKDTGNKIQLHCLYDDGVRKWHNAHKLLEDSKLEVLKYMKEKKISKQGIWRKTCNFWLEEVQGVLCKRRSYEMDNLVTRLHTLWKNEINIHGSHHLDTIIWGRAYKDALEFW